MSVQFWLTDEDSNVPGYKRLKMGTSLIPARSDTPSLVEAPTTTTIAGTAITATRSAGGTALAWVSEQLDGTDLSAGTWNLHVWAKESALTVNAGLRFDIYKLVAGTETLLFSGTAGSELTTAMARMVLAGTDPGEALNPGDRLVLRIVVVNVGTMAAGTVTIAYNGQYPDGEGDTYAICPTTLVANAAVPTQTVTWVQNLLKDNGAVTILTVTEIGQAVQDALRLYSTDKPRMRVGYLSGDGSTQYFPLPADWLWNVSDLLEIEYPLGGTPRSLFELDDWEVVETELNGQPQRLLNVIVSVPDAGTNNMALRYTTRHKHDTLINTIYPDDIAAFYWLTASICATMLANKFSFVADSTINADSVNYGQKPTDWDSRAKAWRKLYDDHVRQQDPAIRAVSRTQDWDTNSSFYGVDRLTHPRRLR